MQRRPALLRTLCEISHTITCMTRYSILYCAGITQEVSLNNLLGAYSTSASRLAVYPRRVACKMIFRQHITRLIPFERGALFGPSYNPSKREAHAAYPYTSKLRDSPRMRGILLQNILTSEPQATRGDTPQVIAPSFSTSCKQH